MKRKKVLSLLMAAAMAASTVFPAYAEDLSAAGVDIVEAGVDAAVADEPAPAQEQEELEILEVQDGSAGPEETPDGVVVEIMDVTGAEDPEIGGAEEDGSIQEVMEEVIVEDAGLAVEEGDEIGIPAEEMEGMEIQLDEQIQLAEAGAPEDAANLSASKKKKIGSGLYAGMAGAAYVDSYGGELLGNYADVYNGCYSSFVAGASMDEAVINLSEAFLFSVDISDPEQGVTSSDIASSEDYQENVIPEIKAIGQAANDAIAYDCPEVFWISNFNIAPTSATVVSVNEDRTKAICGVSKVKMTATERFSDAYDSRETFSENVNAAYASLKADLEGKATWEIVKGIHDYICENASYGQGNGAAVSHTAAGFFLYNGERFIVCDGYAKALQVLCNKFGIKSTLIAGDVTRASGETESHAWNYVLVDGTYYLVDATWDDEGASAATTYLLKGWNSVGSTGKAIAEERTEYNAFSNTAYSSTFARPSLSYAEFHAWGDGEVTKEPTCTADGVKTYTCAICKETKDEPVAMSAHSWEETETVDKEASCEEEGSKSIHCSVCGTSKEGSEVSIPVKGHAWGEGTVSKEATCSEEGVKKFTCADCGKEKTEAISKASHTWESEARVDTEATCLQPGSKSIHCSVCGASDEESREEIPTADHTWNKGDVAKEATCSEEGTMEYTCTVCGETKTEAIEKTEHTWEEEAAVDKEATCEEEGSESIHCSVCGESKPDSETAIPALEHEWDEGVITKEPSCEEHGTMEYTCTVCEEKKTEIVNPEGHKWSSEITVDKAPTCTEAGKGSYRCRTCDEVQSDVTLKATGHSYTSWKIKTPASIQSRAIQKRTCAACGNTETRYYGTKATPSMKLPSSSLAMKVNQKASSKVIIANGDKIKTWKTSNKNIVQVKGKPDGTFTLTSQGKTGSAYITITTGTKITKKIKVTVKPGTSSISNVPKSVSVKKGKTYSLKAKKNPSNSIDTLTYSSSKPSVASVDANGKITAKKKGTAVIIVKAGSKVKKCTVKVK